jgi:hypothetical protein
MGFKWRGECIKIGKAGAYAQIHSRLIQKLPEISSSVENQKGRSHGGKSDMSEM